MRLFGAFLRNIIDPLIFPIILISALGAGFLYVVVPQLSQDNFQREALQKARTALANLKSFRTYYQSDVLQPLYDANLLSPEQLMSDDPLLPFPIQVMMHMGEAFSQAQELKVRIYSHYPYPWREQRQLDAMEQDFLAELSKRPHIPQMQWDIQAGKSVLRIAFAEQMNHPACLQCHNSHPKSPKRDWRMGDMRGVVEIIQPYNQEVILTQEQVRDLLSYLFIMLALLVAYYSLLILVRKRNFEKTKHQLEVRVDERTQDLQRLVRNLEEYKKAVDVSAIVSKTTPDGKITYVNRFFVDISGFSQSELLGQTHGLIRHPDTPQSLFVDLWDTIRDKKVWKGIIKNRRKDGSAYYVATSIVPLLNQQNEVEEYIAIRFEVSQLISAIHKAKEAEKAKSTFLANMSHEIRTPLNAIIGFSEILSNGNTLMDADRHYAKIIDSSAKSLLHIINDILDISKIESGQFELQVSHVNLLLLVEQVVDLFTVKAKEKELEFVVDIDTHLHPHVETDGVRLRQVLSNLISNAIKFTPKGKRIYFRVTLLRPLPQPGEASQLRFEVVDTGIGIPQDKLQQIFEPFVQIDNRISRQYEGTGLGLSISMNILRGLGSELNVESQLEQGSRFWFDLVFKPSAETDEQDFPQTSTTPMCTLAIAQEDNELLQLALPYLHQLARVVNAGDGQNPQLEVWALEADGGVPSQWQEHAQLPRLILAASETHLSAIQLSPQDRSVCLPFYAKRLQQVLGEILENVQSSPTNLEKDMPHSPSWPGRVLVAEDNPANQMLISHHLDCLHIDFDLAVDGEDAVSHYANNDYALVLMDINMPKMDGVEAFHAIRRLEEQRGQRAVPVVAVTANALKGDKERFIQAGMSDYLSKPINVKELEALFQKYRPQADLPLTPTTEEVLSSPSADPQEQEIQEIVIDLAVLQRNLGVDEMIAQMLVDNFKLTLEGDLVKMRHAVESGNAQAIKHQAHYIKNGCLNMYLQPLVDAFQQLESAADQPQSVAEAWTQIQQMMARLRFPQS